MDKNTGYIDKSQAEEQGFIRTPRGVYKLNALEQLYHRGKLECGDPQYGGQDRLRAGTKLSSDYEKSHFNTIGSFWKNDKIDQQGGKYSDVAIEHFRSRYLTAVRAIPREFWPIVRQICIENTIPPADKNISSRQRSEMAYLFRWDLCRGLDRLIEHYITAKIKF